MKVEKSTQMYKTGSTASSWKTLPTPDAMSPIDLSFELAITLFSRNINGLDPGERLSMEGAHSPGHR